MNRPPPEWIATAASRIYAARIARGDGPDTEGAFDPGDTELAHRATLEALKVWREALVVSGAPKIDFWALAFEEGTGFEDAAEQSPIPPDAASDARMFEDVATRVFRGRSKLKAVSLLREMINRHEGLRHHNRFWTDRSGQEWVRPTGARWLFNVRKREKSKSASERGSKGARAKKK